MQDASNTASTTLSVIEGNKTAASRDARADLDRPTVALSDVISGTGARAGVLAVLDGPLLTDVAAVRSGLASPLDRAAHSELDVILTGGKAQWLSGPAALRLGRGIGAHVLVVPVLRGSTVVAGALLGYDEPVAFSDADRAFLVRAFAVRSTETSPLRIAAA